MYKKYLATQEREAISLSLGKAKENSYPCMIGYLAPKNTDFINYILFIVNVMIFRYLQRALDFPGGTVVKNLPANAGDMGLIPGSEDCLEKEMATHSSILA